MLEIKLQLVRRGESYLFFSFVLENPVFSMLPEALVVLDDKVITSKLIPLRVITGIPLILDKNQNG